MSDGWMEKVNEINIELHCFHWKTQLNLFKPMFKAERGLACDPDEPPECSGGRALAWWSVQPDPQPKSGPGTL